MMLNRRVAVNEKVSKPDHLTGAGNATHERGIDLGELSERFADDLEFSLDG